MRDLAAARGVRDRGGILQITSREGQYVLRVIREFGFVGGTVLLFEMLSSKVSIESIGVRSIGLNGRSSPYTRYS